MLCLNRKPQEVVKIIVPPSDTAQVIEVMVCNVIHRKVRLGFEAADKVRILRAEIEKGQPK